MSENRDVADPKNRLPAVRIRPPRDEPILVAKEAEYGRL